MASLATAKKGEVVILKGGKRVIADGRGGGRVDRGKPVPKKKPEKKKVKPSGKPTKNKPQPSTVQRGLRAVATQGETVSDLIKQGKGK